MIVHMENLSDFCDELRRERGRIWDSTVRAQTSRRPEQPEEVSFSVCFIATAIIVKETGDFLLQCALSTGSERAGERQLATEEAERLLRELEASAGEASAEVRKGRYEL